MDTLLLTVGWALALLATVQLSAGARRERRRPVRIELPRNIRRWIR